MKLITFTLLLLMSFKISAHTDSIRDSGEGNGKASYRPLREIFRGHPAEDSRIFDELLTDQQDLFNSCCQFFSSPARAGESLCKLSLSELIKHKSIS